MPPTVGPGFRDCSAPHHGPIANAAYLSAIAVRENRLPVGRGGLETLCQVMMSVETLLLRDHLVGPRDFVLVLLVVGVGGRASCRRAARRGSSPPRCCAGSEPSSALSRAGQMRNDAEKTLDQHQPRAMMHLVLFRGQQHLES